MLDAGLAAEIEAQIGDDRPDARGSRPRQTIPPEAIGWPPEKRAALASRLKEDAYGRRCGTDGKGVIAQVGAIAVSREGGEPLVLLVTAKKNPEHWIFPKGHVERGEELAATALRELDE